MLYILEWNKRLYITEMGKEGNLNDYLLILQMKQGNENAFDKFVRKYYAEILLYWVDIYDVPGALYRCGGDMLPRYICNIYTIKNIFYIAYLLYL